MKRNTEATLHLLFKKLMADVLPRRGDPETRVRYTTGDPLLIVSTWFVHNKHSTQTEELRIVVSDKAIEEFVNADQGRLDELIVRAHRKIAAELLQIDGVLGSWAHTVHIRLEDL